MTWNQEITEKVQETKLGSAEGALDVRDFPRQPRAPAKSEMFRHL